MAMKMHQLIAVIDALDTRAHHMPLWRLIPFGFTLKAEPAAFEAYSAIKVDLVYLPLILSLQYWLLSARFSSFQPPYI